MLTLHPQYLIKEGKEEYVILPINEFITVQDFINKYIKIAIESEIIETDMYFKERKEQLLRFSGCFQSGIKDTSLRVDEYLYGKC